MASGDLESPSSFDLSDNLVVNWIKLGLAVKETKCGLEEIAENEVREFTSQIFDEVRKEQNIPNNIDCTNCTIGTLKLKNSQTRTRIQCAKKLCNNVCSKVASSHRYGQPNWKNTNTIVSQWSTSCWEVAKCFMPDGYCSKMSAGDTDFNGIVNVFINLLPIEKKVTTNLTYQQNNIFTEARQVGKDFRHNEKCRITDAELNDRIKKLTDVLKVPNHISKNIKAQNALKKVEEISKSPWTSDLGKTLQLIKQAAEDFKEDLTREKQTILEDLEQKIEEKIKKGIEAIEDVTEKGIKRVQSEVEEATKRCKREDSDYETRKNELKSRLVTDLEENCNTMSVSPFLEEEETLLLYFFVDPILQIREHHLVKEDTQAKCYKDIFIKNQFWCKHIYLTGEAGVGKTLFCRKMALLWALCHTSRRKLERLSEKDKRDMKTIEHFGFLFFVNLRETCECEIENIIHSQLGYDKSFLQKVLENEKCLIILDGLHEWSHSSACAMFAKIKTPHCRAYQRCTFITTSRPYKLEALRLKRSEIDREVIIKGIDPDSQITFAEKIVRSFSKKKDPEDFLTYMETYAMADLLEIPSAAAHLVCLWIDGKLNDYSPFALYGTMMDNMFQQAMNKNRSTKERSTNPDVEMQTSLDCIVPFKNICMHLDKLKKLFHLAFDTLLAREGNTVSYSKDDIAKYGLTNEEIEDLCVVGIFSKRKAIGFLTERRYKISFFHVCFQEFMAAVYIKMQENYLEEVKQKVTEFCKTYDDVNWLANIFIILASVDAKIVAILFSMVSKTIDSDELAIAFREYSCSSMYNFVSNRKQQIEEKIQSLQKLAMKCYSLDKIAFSNTIGMRVNDIFIYKNNIADVSYLLKISWKYLKSISIFAWSEELKFDHETSDSIQKIEVRYIKIESEFHEIIALMRKCGSSLQNVFIRDCSMFQTVPVKDIQHLRSLYLDNVKMKHMHLRELLSNISAETRLSQIGLENVTCADHENDEIDDCSFGVLDISNHCKMHLLGLSDVSISEIRIKSEILERLKLNCEKCKNQHCILKLLNTLEHAPVLKKIVVSQADNNEVVGQLVRTISTLKQLRYVYMMNIDFQGHALEIDNGCTELEIELSHFKMSRQAFERFLYSMSRQSKKRVICVHLFFFTIRGEDNTELPGHDVAKLIERYNHFQIHSFSKLCIKFKRVTSENALRKASKCDI